MSDMGGSAGGVAGGAVSGAMAGASFGPYGMVAGAAIGVGLQLFGGSQSASSASAYNDAQVQQIQLEQKVEEQRKHAMELDASRKQIENLRNTQRAQALGLNTATNQGAQFGSGLQGGQAQARNQGSWNSLGISQNLEIGENIFGLNAQISQQRIAQANAQQGMQQGQAISSLGSGIMSNLPAIGRISSGFGNQGTTT